MLSCSNFIISLSEFFFVEIIWPLNRTSFLSLIIPFSATIVIDVVFLESEDKLFKLLFLSCKKIFFISLSNFFSTKNVKPLKLSLNC